MRTLLIDNYDSFTYNLFQALTVVNGQPPVVLTNDDPAGLDRLDLSHIDSVVISPGPGRPDRPRDFGISRWAVTQTDLPLLGVCLGHQGLCHAAGARVRPAPQPMHGRLSPVRHSGTGLFAGIPSPLEVVRYHSLIVDEVPDTLEVIAETDDGLVMAVRHRSQPHWGVQFHPESVAATAGLRLLANFRDEVRATGRRRPEPITAVPDPRPRSRAGPTAASPYRLHVRPVHGTVDAETAFATLFADDPGAFWLDSSRVIDGLSRYSMLGGSAGPLAELVSYQVGTGEVRVTDSAGRVVRHREDIFTYLQRSLGERAVADAGLPTGFNLGYVGYLGYELKADCGATAAHRSPLSDAAFVFCDRALVVDHRDRVAWLLALSAPGGETATNAWLEQTAATLATAPPLAAVEVDPGAAPASDGLVPLVARHSTMEYEALIAECLAEIGTGESYEVCLTNMLSSPVRIEPFPAYRLLRRTNPAPYAAYLQLPGCHVLSASPERFLRISPEGEVESKPIKGTRARGRTPVEDSRLAADLARAEKDRAENLMIVDLVRNDIGRVAEPGSVHVPDLFAVETYETVHQLVSTVRGRLRPDVSPVACVRAAFPGGSMTGAPKLRTMEIIDRLEAGPRGVYSGSLGYFSLNGSVDLSIVIRTIVVTEDEVSLGVGGAIVAQSDPTDEIAETWVKARASLRVLGMVARHEAIAAANTEG